MKLLCHGCKFGVSNSIISPRRRAARTNAAIERAGVQALFVGDGPRLNSARAEITAMAARLRLLAMYGFHEFAGDHTADHGACESLSESCDWTSRRRAADEGDELAAVHSNAWFGGVSSLLVLVKPCCHCMVAFQNLQFLRCHCGVGRSPSKI